MEYEDENGPWTPTIKELEKLAAQVNAMDIDTEPSHPSKQSLGYKRPYQTATTILKRSHDKRKTLKKLKKCVRFSLNTETTQMKLNAEEC